CTYALLGAILGMVGNTFNFWGWQQSISIILGLLLVIVCVITIANKRIATSAFIQKNWNNKIINIIAPLFKSKKLSHTFLIGLLNGLLPCGLVYMAIAGAIAAHHAFEGMIFMASFGLGTLPAMLLLGITGNMLSIKW